MAEGVVSDPGETSVATCTSTQMIGIKMLQVNMSILIESYLILSVHKEKSFQKWVFVLSFFFDNSAHGLMIYSDFTLGARMNTS